MEEDDNLNKRDENGMYPILSMCAADEGYSVKKLKTMIEKGADVNVCTPKE